MPECRLCNKEKTLCKSHIYPEYMYKHCYDEHHKFIEFNAKDGTYNKRKSSGIYEYLLCRDCEGIIQKYEDYAKHIIYDKAKPYIYRNRSCYTDKNYNYNYFKLFILSLLWRASISSMTGFQQASLGKYEENLRHILLNEIETPVNEFPCLIYQAYNGEEPADGTFMEIHPGKSKHDGKTIYHFIADGLFFFVAVGSSSKKNFPEGSSVSPEKVRIACDQLSKIDSFTKLFVRIHKQGKFSVYENM